MGTILSVPLWLAYGSVQSKYVNPGTIDFSDWVVWFGW